MFKRFNSYTSKNKLKEHEKICNNHNSYRIEMFEWVNKILKHNPEEKSSKKPFAIYLDLECTLKKLKSIQNNPEKSYTEKKPRHEPSGWAMFTRCLFDKRENTLNYYRGKDCIEKLCKDLKENAMEIINYIKKEMIPLTHEENKFCKEQEACYICKEKFCTDKNDKNYINKKKVKNHCHYTGKCRGAAHCKCNLNYKDPKEITIIIHNASYDTHFILKQLVKEFKGELNCIGDNREKYITFSVPINKECDNGKTITYKFKFIDSFRFMPTSLSELVDNASGIFNSIECKSSIEKIKINSECCFVALKNKRLIYKCKECNEEWKRPLNKLIENFPSIYQFCDGNLNKFAKCLSL